MLNTLTKCTDLQFLERITRSDQKLMMEMIAMYMEQTPIQIDAIKSSFLTEDWNLMKASAHKLVPSFQIVGLKDKYKELAIQIQDFNIDRQKPSEIRESVIKLEMICLKACSELKDEYEILRVEMENGSVKQKKNN